MPAVAAVAAVGALGYGIYSGERARAQAQQQYDDAQRNAQAQMTEEQRQMAENDRRMEEQRQRQIAEQAATRERVLGELPGMKERLGADLLTQQEAAYARMTPQMEARLNALGLLQSGALPEAQAKAQKDLEMQRQAALSDFSMGAEKQLNIIQPYEDMRSNLDTQQKNLAQTFANQNAYNQNQTATQQYLSGLQAANNSAAQKSASSYMQLGGALGSGLISNYYNKTQSTTTKIDPAVAALQSYRSPAASSLDYSGTYYRPQPFRY